MSSERAVSRRGFLGVAAGTAVAGAAGPAAAQEAERPDWGGWLSEADGGYVDARGESEVTVQVGADGNNGAFAFSPAGLWVDPGTTVTWEWTGQGGGHNVVAEEGPASLDSGDTVSEAGATYEYTFEEGGITTYFCSPHRSLEMKGAVAVGDDVPTGDSGGGTPAMTEGEGMETTSRRAAAGPDGYVSNTVVAGFAAVFFALLLGPMLYLTFLDTGPSQEPPQFDDGEDDDDAAEGEDATAIEAGEEDEGGAADDGADAGDGET